MNFAPGVRPLPRGEWDDLYRRLSEQLAELDRYLSANGDDLPDSVAVQHWFAGKMTELAALFLGEFGSERFEQLRAITLVLNARATPPSSRRPRARPPGMALRRSRVARAAKAARP